MAEKITSIDVYRGLEKSLNRDEWVLFPEIRVPFGSSWRTADAIGVNCWKSRGYRVAGYEIKVTRSDWLREMKKPVKAEAFERYVNEWWIVAPPGIVDLKKDDMPPGWGLMEFNGKTMARKKKAKISKHRIIKGDPVIPVTILASMGRRTREKLQSLPEVRMAYEQGRTRGYEEGHAEGQRGEGAPSNSEEVRRLTLQVSTLKAKLKAHEDFLSSQGVERYSQFDIPRIGQFIRLMQTVGVDGIERIYKQMHSQSKHLHERLEVALKELEPTKEAKR